MTELFLEVRRSGEQDSGDCSDENSEAEIKLIGDWLDRLGFKIGDRVVLRASRGRITLTAEWVDQCGLL